MIQGGDPEGVRENKQATEEEEEEEEVGGKGKVKREGGGHVHPKNRGYHR